MPFKLLKGAKNDDEDLKNWKPMKITESIDQKKEELKK